jgi:hypothetical protein
MDIIRATLNPKVIDAITRNVRPALRNELRNFLNERPARIPDGMEEEFANELRGLVQEIGSGSSGEVSSVAGEVVGAIEAGLIIGKGAQIVNEIEDLIERKEDEGIRQEVRDRLSRSLRDNPELFTRLPDIGAPELIQADIQRSIREREIQAGKEGKVPETRTIRSRDPKKQIQRPVTDDFIDISLEDPDPEFEPLEPEDKTEGSDPPFPPLLPPKVPFRTKEKIAQQRRPFIPPPNIDTPPIPDDPKILDGIARGLGFQRQQIPTRPVFLPDDTKSYNYVELVRVANANALFQDNIFNTAY